ncbi:MAG: hypothetical protein U0930_07600 [Pirellulales bacterium]
MLDATWNQTRPKAALPKMLAGTILAAFIGCDASPRSAPAPAQTTSAIVVPYAPAEVKLGEIKATFEAPDVVTLKIPYLFTVGKPVAYYKCEVSFPESKQGGVKMMEAWELQEEGTIKTGFNVTTPPGATVEVVLSEAERPDKGYKPISERASSSISVSN